MAAFQKAGLDSAPCLGCIFVIELSDPMPDIQHKRFYVLDDMLKNTYWLLVGNKGIQSLYKPPFSISPCLNVGWNPIPPTPESHLKVAHVVVGGRLIRLQALPRPSNVVPFWVWYGFLGWDSY